MHINHCSKSSKHPSFHQVYMVRVCLPHMFRNQKPVDASEAYPNRCDDSRPQEKLGFCTLCRIPVLFDGKNPNNIYLRP